MRENRYNYSRPSQYRQPRDWRKSGSIPKPAVKGVIYKYNREKPYLGLENGRPYEGGGGERRDGIGGGDDCTY